ncbi:phosphoribosyltransferase [Anabaena sp. FACHB-1237]|uniref:phosphoribosyltransferase n=1 Tax=Anabaena sp. FACHB-1237 TaxID=2692769 RepID=UPI001F55A856|nr:phosphoribosyltransferase [Anabaena sp. FACHB-1237]
MLEYMKSQQCLMAFLATELDDPNPQECGRCTVCVGTRLLPETVTNARVNKANLFLRRSNQILEPRKQWPSQALLTYKFSGNIKTNLRAETGRALSLWGDAGWGELVKKGKYRDNHFDDELVQATFEMIQNWQPQPFPTWVTCVPSLNRPELVPNFAKRLADKLGLPFKPVVRKIRHTQLQKNMSNSYQQAHNLDGAFLIESWQGMSGNVFLIDDMVDSRWTFTVIAALLRNTGSGLVYPVALALNSLGQED